MEFINIIVNSPVVNKVEFLKQFYSRDGGATYDYESKMNLYGFNFFLW